MTVIAYRDGILAADRLVSDEWDLIAGHKTKIFGLAGAFYGFSGTLSEGGAFRNWVDDGCLSVLPEFKDFQAIRIAPNGRVALASGKHPVFVEVEATFFAIGSGRELALGAMWKGATAAEAVDCAIALSISCGGTVDTIVCLDHSVRVGQLPEDLSLRKAATHTGGPR